LTFVGRDYQGFGQAMNQNLATLLTNSANITPPNNPITGQLWYDTVDKKLRVYDNNGTQFTVVGAATTSVATQIPANLGPGDFWFDTTNQVLNVWNGTTFIALNGYPRDPLNYGQFLPSGWEVRPTPILSNTGFPKDVVVLESFGIRMGALTNESTFTLSVNDSTYFGINQLVQGLTIIGQISATSNLSTGGELTIANNNGHGGTNYAGLLTLTNTNTTATNSSKFIRMNATGDLEIVNSAYTKEIFALSDTGQLKLSGTVGTPVNTTTPQSWLNVLVDGSSYYIPLYQ
jgi:hypothetical protein